MSRERLDFLRPSVIYGVNVTVRNGRKWDVIVTHLPYRVAFGETGVDEPLGEVLIIGKMVCPFLDIPDALLGLEHDPRCSQMRGLIKAMQNAYGDSWSVNSEATVLFFQVVGPQ